MYEKWSDRYATLEGVERLVVDDYLDYVAEQMSSDPEMAELVGSKQEARPPAGGTPAGRRAASSAPSPRPKSAELAATTCEP